MSPLACVDLPLLALQLILRRETSWQDFPVAVVADDRPQAEILEVNEHARRARVRPGLTYAAGRNLAPHLRADVVTPEQLRDVTGELFARLTSFSPRVEPSVDLPGVFWLDPSGLTGLYGSMEQWAKTISDDLRGLQFESRVIVGFHRFRTHALARVLPGNRVFATAHEEAKAATRVPLDRLPLPPKLRDGLAVLGVRNLGDFLRLPGPEIQNRFGKVAARLHHEASDADWSPLAPQPLEDPIVTRRSLEPPDHNHHRILFVLKGALHEVLLRLADKGLALRVLRLTFALDHMDRPHVEQLEPARPTLDEAAILELIRLRLDNISLPAAVEEITLELEGLRANKDQLVLFRTQTRRNLDDAAKALARVRAAFGDAAVTRAALVNAHLPEAGFRYSTVDCVAFPSIRPVPEQTPLVRLLLPRPVPLPPPPRAEPERWLESVGAAAVACLHGPFRVSGGWWVRTVERDYYYAETRLGEFLWIFFDRPRRRWFLHGRVD